MGRVGERLVKPVGEMWNDVERMPRLDVEFGVVGAEMGGDLLRALRFVIPGLVKADGELNPESFTFMESIGVLAMVILGGMGSIPGAVLGATGVTILNLQLLKGLSLWLNGLRQSGAELVIPLVGSYPLSQLPAQFEPAKYERMVFGLILILMMIFRPQGILPPRQGSGK